MSSLTGNPTLENRNHLGLSEGEGKREKGGERERGKVRLRTHKRDYFVRPLQVLPVLDSYRRGVVGRPLTPGVRLSEVSLLTTVGGALEPSPSKEVN